MAEIQVARRTVIWGGDGLTAERTIEGGHECKEDCDWGAMTSRVTVIGGGGNNCKGHYDMMGTVIISQCFFAVQGGLCDSVNCHPHSSLQDTDSSPLLFTISILLATNLQFAGIE